MEFHSQAGAVMCSYNAVNGQPMCTNAELIGGKLREDFGFTGVLATVRQHIWFRQTLFVSAAS